MRRGLGTIVLFIGSLFLCSQPVHATSGAGVNLGVFTTNAAKDTGSREWIELTGTGGLLSGRPHHPSIALVTVYAPGTARGHLILRELVSSDGRRSLLFSAPASLVQATRRVTLYVKHHVEHLVLLEYEEGHWSHRQPQPMRVTAENGHGTSQDHLLAFSVAGFGLYWLVESPAPDVSGLSRIPQTSSASAIVGGGISRGVLPWIWSVLLLLAGWTVSRLIHGIEQRAGK